MSRKNDVAAGGAPWELRCPHTGEQAEPNQHRVKAAPRIKTGDARSVDGGGQSVCASTRISSAPRR